MTTFGVRLLSFLGLIVIWELASTLIASPRIFPGPIVVATLFAVEFQHGGLPHHLAITMARVLASFCIAMSFGTVIGLSMGRYKLVDALFDGWLIFFLNLPALVVIVLAYVWFGLSESAAIGAVAINKIPSVIATVREGTRAIDRNLTEMAHVYRLGWRRTLTKVVMPQLIPYLLVSTRTGLSLIWKIVLVVEMLGRSDGIGFQIHTYFQLFDVGRILAYSIAFIVVVQGIEWGLLIPIENHLNRWRR